MSRRKPGHGSAFLRREGGEYNTRKGNKPAGCVRFLASRHPAALCSGSCLMARRAACTTNPVTGCPKARNTTCYAYATNCACSPPWPAHAHATKAPRACPPFPAAVGALPAASGRAGGGCAGGFGWCAVVTCVWFVRELPGRQTGRSERGRGRGRVPCVVLPRQVESHDDDD